MATNHEHIEAIDQLQSNLNQTLEETGRLFAAMLANPNSPPTAHAARLKTLLPVAENNFHTALDKLEWELQRAMKVMRRDLAVCRELSGVPPQQSAQAQQQSPQQPKNVPQAAPASSTDRPSDASKVESNTAPEPATEDTAMTDSPSRQDEKPSSMEKSPVPAAALGPDSKSAPHEGPKPAAPPAAESKAAQDESQPPPNGLPYIDTSAAPPISETSKPEDKKPTEEEKAPDTANDLDSLFNDPMSGGGADASADFTFDQNDTGNDLNFDAFGADNDNISSLLPGLEDYANTQPNSNSNDANEVDLDQLLGGFDDNQGGMDSQGAGEQRDTTFDDLMDLANFDTGMDGDTDNGDNNTNNNDFDFDSLFN